MNGLETTSAFASTSMPATERATRRLQSFAAHPIGVVGAALADGVETSLRTISYICHIPHIIYSKCLCMCKPHSIKLQPLSTHGLHFLGKRFHCWFEKTCENVPMNCDSPNGSTAVFCSASQSIRRIRNAKDSGLQQRQRVQRTRTVTFWELDQCSDPEKIIYLFQSYEYFSEDRSTAT